MAVAVAGMVPGLLNREAIHNHEASPSSVSSSTYNAPTCASYPKEGPSYGLMNQDRR